MLGLAVLDAARDVGNEWVFPKLVAEGLEPWNGVRSVCFNGAQNPTHAVDVTGEPLERGIAALSANERYLGGLGDSAPDPRSLLTSFTQNGGVSLGVANAVTFDVYQL